MRVRYWHGETELLGLSWTDFMSVELPDLTVVPEDDLRRSHRHAKRQLWEASGPHRMGGGHVVLDPIEAEMKRRGLKAVYWAEERMLRDLIEAMIPLT
jgi:hypothetical protein